MSNTDLYKPGEDPLLVSGKYVVYELVLTAEKIGVLWALISRFKTLFSDLTRGDLGNFVRYITDKDSIWLEVHESNKLVGIVCLTNMYKIVDTDAHIIFFTIELSDKVDVCKAIMRWAFTKFPLQRVSVDVPAIYHRTKRLVRRIGLKFEGTRRRSVLIGGHWLDVELYGIIRTEALSVVPNGSAEGTGSRRRDQLQEVSGAVHPGTGPGSSVPEHDGPDSVPDDVRSESSTGGSAGEGDRR